MIKVPTHYIHQLFRAAGLECYLTNLASDWETILREDPFTFRCVFVACFFFVSLFLSFFAIFPSVFLVCLDVVVLPRRCDVGCNGLTKRPFNLAITTCGLCLSGVSRHCVLYRWRPVLHKVGLLYVRSVCRHIANREPSVNKTKKKFFDTRSAKE